MTLIIIIITVIISIIAFTNPVWNSKMMFNAYLVKNHKQYYRFVTSGLVHGDWVHLAINMLVFYSFGTVVEQYYNSVFGEKGFWNFLLLYVGSLVFSELSSFIKYQNNPSYNSLGASGAVSAIVFASIVFQPLAKIYIWGILPLPGILLGAGYLFFSAYLAKKQQSHINHEAHFYGAIYGFFFTVLLKPSLAIHFINRLLNF